MTTTMAELEQRVAELEREVSRLRQLLEARASPETSADDGVLLLTEAEQAEFAAEWKRMMEEMGIRGEPIGAEALRARMLASGIKPEDNAFSRGIIEMREE